MSNDATVHTNNDVLRELTPRQIERFWAKVRKGDGCWIWTGAIHPNGYGTWTVHRPGAGAPPRSTSIRPHRLSWWLVRGPIPDGHVIDHLCSNRACCNPDHLEPVSPSQNGSRAPRDALVALNAEAELERVIAASANPRVAAKAVIAMVTSYPEMFELMRRPTVRAVS